MKLPTSIFLSVASVSLTIFISIKGCERERNIDTVSRCIDKITQAAKNTGKPTTLEGATKLCNTLKNQ
jgi:hypothetical protein